MEQQEDIIIVMVVVVGVEKEALMRSFWLFRDTDLFTV